jgi:hypothetical protein
VSSSFFAANDVVYVSNRRFDTLIAFVIEVALSVQPTPEQESFIERLKTAQEFMYPGFYLVLEEQFPQLSERRFWAAVFSEVARRISRGEIGNPSPPVEWRAQAAAEADKIARLLLANEA